ncbi:hypothetical protein N0V88_000005 [Collariella sp. IMI 366227]|nr:hypothetical protein N0V88_000005 [Collariella sp. IMI 366227]
MPPLERDAPRDLNGTLRHQHAASIDHNRALVPMWDSSDPERAPPPLPLNPQSPTVSRTGTSSVIQSAHAAIAEKARESAALVPHIPKRADASPERPNLRPSSHRRMQSLQPSSVEDMSFMIESSRDSLQSTPRSPEKMDRPTTPQRRESLFSEPKEDRQDRSTAGTPTPGPSLTPIIRPTVRRPQQSILGENTPPQSATMLALQNMSSLSASSTPAPREPETPLANITNGSKALVRAPQNLEALSSQILTLTDIATTLQKEMSLLSRRSRDNATDLLSLKEATNTRDEDIRKSLRELMTDAKTRAATRDPYGGPLLLEGRHHPSSPTQVSKTARPFSLPRIPSPNSFAASLDRESLLSTPSLISDSGSPATVALLEKIIRDMGTKDGQENLLNRLADLTDRLAGMATGEKVEELTRFVKSNQQQAMIPGAGGRGGGGDGGIRDRHWSFGDDDDRSHQGALDFLHAAASASQGSRFLSGQEGRTRAADVINDDVMKVIKSVKDSVAQGGGLTAEVKALVRELRGEVLGMGREIGRRLDEVADKNIGQPESVTKAEMTEVVEQGLSEMSQQMNALLREHRRQSAASLASRESSVDYKEIYNSVRAALKDTQATKSRSPELKREDVLHAVKDAWEKYKPEIEIQQIGLERDEVLDCLQEGLRAYAPRDDRPPGATREEVFQAVIEGMKHFSPPKVELLPPSRGRKFSKQLGNASRTLIAQSVTKSEVSDVIKSALKNLDLSPEIFDAVKEGLDTFDLPTTVSQAIQKTLAGFDFAAAAAAAAAAIPRPDLSRVDVADAVVNSPLAADAPAAAAAGMSREEVVDAVREGLEGGSGGDVSEAVRKVLEGIDFGKGFESALVGVAAKPEVSKEDVVEAVREELAKVKLEKGVQHQQKEEKEVKGLAKEDIVEAVKEGLDVLDLSRKDVIDAVKEGLDNLELSRDDMVDAVKEGLDFLDLRDDVVDAVKEGLDALDLSRKDVVDAVKEGLASLDMSADFGDAVKKELQAFDFSAVQSAALVAQTPSKDDEVMQRLREIKELLQAEIKAASEEAKQNIAANALGTEQIIDATKNGLDKLREDIEGYVDRAKDETTNPQHLLDQLLNTLDVFQDEISELVNKSTDASKAMLKEEIESLRDAVNSSLIPALPQPGNNKEVLEALHEGMHGLRSEISTRPIAGLNEILDALQEGLGDVRVSITNLRDKPADLTANDEILEALRAGIDSVRSDIDSLRETKALAIVNDKALMPPPPEGTLKQDDIKNLETLITQLGVKVEAMEKAPKPVVTSLSKEDLADMEKRLQDVASSVAAMPVRQPFESLEESLRKIQDTVTELSTKEAAAPPRSLTDPASKEDVEAIETILRNTKGRLDDLMDGEQAVRKDHIDTLETLILEAKESLSGFSTHLDGISRKEHIDTLETLIIETRESLGGVATQMDSISRKEDVAMVESLVTQVVAAFDEMKERHEKALEDPEKITKTDVEAVEAVCLDTKSMIEHIQKVDLANLPSKEDVEALETRLENLKERLDGHAEASVKAFEERQAETVGVGVSVTEVRTVLEEFQTLVRSKMEDGARGIDSLHNILDTLGESIKKNDTVGEDLKEVLDTVKLEFEDSKTTMVGVKIDLDEKLQTTADTLLAKLDERMADLVTKYEEIQLLADDRATKSEARDVEMEVAVSGTKAIAEELKTLVDILGTAVTDSMEKMEEASKTVFERVEDLVTKSEDNHTDGKAEHLLTREQVQEAIGKVDGLQGQVAEYQPKILETVQEVMVVLAEHYETLKSSAVAIQERVENPIFPPPPEKYDDTAVMERLDALVGHTSTADKAFEQLETLDLVHAQVKATSVELAAFLAAQTQRIADEHEDREKTLQETTVALERRLEEKEQIEAHIAGLKEEEARVKEAITVTLPEEQAKINEQFLINLQTEETRLKETTTALLEEQAQLKDTFVTVLKEEQARLMEANVSLKEEQDELKVQFLINLQEEQARIMETNVALKEEQDKLKETFLTNLKEEEGRLKEMNDALRDEQQLLRNAFLANLKEEQARIMETNVTLKEEQDKLKETFLTNLREEETLLKAANTSLREEQTQLREIFLTSFKEEQAQLKDTFLANFKEEEQRLREANDILRQEQVTLKASLAEEKELLKTTLKAEQEQVRASLKEEHERFKIELLANLMEEEARLKDANTVLREEQELMRAGFLATLQEEETRVKDGLTALREEQDSLAKQKSRLTADLSSLDTALRLRREELHDMEARAESLERRILEGVMDHSRVLLMAKTNRANALAHSNSGRDSMSRKRVSSAHKHTDTPHTTTTTANDSKPRSAINLAMSARAKNTSSPKSNNHNNHGHNTTHNNPSFASSTSSSTSRRILSLSQINNNVPSGGMKRSQSVRTAGGPKQRKGSWAPAVPTIPTNTNRRESMRAASKGYGDLGASMNGGGGDAENKENFGVGEGEEDSYLARETEVNGEGQGGEMPEIVISGEQSFVDGEGETVEVLVTPSAETPLGDEQHLEVPDEEVESQEYTVEDQFSELGDKEEEEDARSLRRASHGTTVITPAEELGQEEEEEEEEEWSDPEEEQYAGEGDDVASTWTESLPGSRRVSGIDAVPVAAAV